MSYARECLVDGYLAARFEFCQITFRTRADAHSISHITPSTTDCLGPDAALEVLSRAAIALWRLELCTRKHHERAGSRPAISWHSHSIPLREIHIPSRARGRRGGRLGVHWRAHRSSSAVLSVDVFSSLRVTLRLYEHDEWPNFFDSQSTVSRQGTETGKMAAEDMVSFQFL
eukprot:scaffold1446_cov175-Ochromonas_danica.AAC.20